MLSFDLALVKGSAAMTDFKLSQLFGNPLKASRVKIEFISILYNSNVHTLPHTVCRIPQDSVILYVLK